MNRQLPTIDRLYGSEDLHEGARAFAERRDPVWQGIAVLEGYIFAALVYAVFSYGMGSYSRFIERRLKTDHSHGRH